MNLVKQSGFILMTVMLLLIVITLLGIHMLQDSILQTKMSANYYQRNKLLNAAETALIKAEEQVVAKGILTAELSEQDNQAAWLKRGRPLIMKGLVVRFAAFPLQSECYQSNRYKEYRDFLRITVWVLDNKSEGPVLLSSTYAKAGVKPSKAQPCLLQAAPKVGRQSWLLLH